LLFCGGAWWDAGEDISQLFSTQVGSEAVFEFESHMQVHVSMVPHDV
jgi:hypothetical protein